MVGTSESRALVHLSNGHVRDLIEELQAALWMNWVCGIAIVFHTALPLWNPLDLCLGGLLCPAQRWHRRSSESHWITGCLPLRRDSRWSCDELQNDEGPSAVWVVAVCRSTTGVEFSILFKSCSFETVNSSGADPRYV